MNRNAQGKEDKSKEKAVMNSKDFMNRNTQDESQVEVNDKRKTVEITETSTISTPHSLMPHPSSAA